MPRMSRTVIRWLAPRTPFKVPSTRVKGIFAGEALLKILVGTRMGAPASSNGRHLMLRYQVPLGFLKRPFPCTWKAMYPGGIKPVLLESKSEGLPDFDFPVLMGLESGFDPELLARNGKRIELYRRLIRDLDENGAGLSRDLSEVHLQDAGSVSIVLNDDTVLVHIGADHLQERFRRYLAMSRELKEKYRLLESVDLRFENQVVVNAANEKIISNSGN